MTKLKIIFYLFCLSLISTNALANNQDQLEQYFQQQNQDLELKNQIKEIEKIKKTKEQADQAKQQAKKYEDLACITIKNITFTGNQIFSKKKLENLIQIKLGDCVSKNQLSEARSAIQNLYMNNGYSLARIYFDFKTLANGHLKFIISEGHSEEIILKDNSKLNNKFPIRRQTQIFTALPNKTGRVFNLPDIEQGLEQINSLSSNNPRNIDAKLTYSQSLHSPAALEAEDEETIYFEVKINL